MQQRHVETAQGRIAYEVHGPESASPPIVLVPGFQSSAKTWGMRGYLEPLADMRLLCIDPLGHGESHMSHDEADYTSDRVVRHVEAMLDDAGVDRATIWGFSRGGLIAALCGELMTDRCAHVVMGGAPIGRATELTHPGLAAAEPLLAAGDWDSYWASFPVPIPDELKAYFVANNDPQALAAAIRGMGRWNDEVPNPRWSGTGVATFAYFGTGEIFADHLRTELDANDIAFHEGDWPGHAETMADAAGVTSVVREFLASTSPPCP